MKRTIVNLLYGTVLSVLVFFSVSFVTVLFEINTPLNRMGGAYQFEIGYPFVYYSEFFVDCPVPNGGWHLVNLFWDCFLTWVIVNVVVLFVFSYIKRRATNIY